jgi:Domain of unknown function (DUF4232)
MTAEAETVAGAKATSNILCGADHLSVTWRGSTGGLAGHSGDLFWIRNTGSVDCALRGYPIVRFLASGRLAPLTSSEAISPLGRPTGLRRGRPPLVRLAPGKVASFWVVGNDVVMPCRDLASMVIVVRALKGRAVISSPPAYSSWPFCGSGVTVSPILPGTSGSVPPVAMRTIISFGP